MIETEILASVLAVIVVCACGFLTHCIFNILFTAHSEEKHPIKTLLYQMKMLTIIWVLFVPAGLIIDKHIFKLLGSAQDQYLLVGYVYGILLFGILFFMYISIYYIIDRSVSSRIMIAINRSPQNCLTLEEIKEVYDIDHKYQTEFLGMIQGGFVKEAEGGYYVNTVKGSLFAKFIGLFKKIYKNGLGGY